MTAPAVLVLAGLDPSGAAGLLADAEAVRAVGARPLCVATALTVQTTRAARSYEPVSASLVTASAAALLEEEDVRAIKIGMLGDARVAKALEKLLSSRADLPRVVDPVLQASSGLLLFKGSLHSARECILSLAQGAVLTPNLPEAQVLLDGPPDAAALLRVGPSAVLLKGGHAEGEMVVDVLATRAGTERFEDARIHARARGTGCRLASALAAGLALDLPLREAVKRARDVVRAHLLSHM